MRIAPLASLLLSLAACTTFDGLEVDVEPPSTGGERSASTETETETDGTTPNENDRAPRPDGANVPDAMNPHASAPSCAKQHGGTTCGPDRKGDCCAVAAQGETKLGKYMITAGRMRAFIEKTNGDVAGFVKGLGAKWNDAWPTAGLPTSIASADVALGPRGKKACEQGENTGHTYWTPKTGADFSDYERATLDEKALNCVPWSLAQALCAFDGGHLATVKELRSAFTNDGTTRFPWGDDEINVNAPDPRERLNIKFGFVTEVEVANFRGTSGHPSEVSFFIAPPGSFPAGDNKAGIADSAGNLLEWVGDSERQFVWKGDFEDHAANAVLLSGSIWMDQELIARIPTGKAWRWGENQLAGNAGNGSQKDGYYAIGARCAF